MTILNGLKLLSFTDTVSSCIADDTGFLGELARVLLKMGPEPGPAKPERLFAHSLCGALFMVNSFGIFDDKNASCS